MGLSGLHRDALAADRRIGLMIHDGGTASIRIHFCPWCGIRLPTDSDAERE